MQICASCVRESEGDFAFCPYCGAPFAAAAQPREQRKTVTVLFCDISGSTSLGESIDPEALRALLARYFDRMKGIVEAHSGSVEKFIGDAVMAVFGVPVVHEDDALRAVRAALEMRDALPEVGLAGRIGVNTGEVVTGTAERLATGDAVNVAARLEQAAEPGAVLLGEETLRLVRSAVEVEPVEPLDLKGKTDPVLAYRLLSVHDASERRPTTAMVGRETELRRLAAAFEQAVHDHSCQLFTVLGAAGVGKSRLVAEFLQTIDGKVVRGRCLPYGEGITYWPVIEVLKQLDAVPSDPAAAAALRSLLGETGVGTSAEEIAWAFRKLLEEQAQERTLVCVFDDLHWGEQTFLELVEHVADLSRDVPILLLCMARPELLEKSPGWGGGKWNATTVLLEPLDGAETEQLLDELGDVKGELRERITRAAEGNPLFLEEILALVRGSGDREIAVPPTIQALLAARLDQLDPSERAVLQCGSVEGRVFHRSAVQALSDENGQLSSRLIGLVRKELVRPDRPQFPVDDAYRFRHLLIRDAAYDALPKAERAELHERLAAWLEERQATLVELDEIVGHHLEQAARYRKDLGEPDPNLAERAAERLAAAGRRALWRGDPRAAASLLARAVALVQPVRLNVHLELDLARALFGHDIERAVAVAETVTESAQAAGDQAGAALARVVAGHYRLFSVADIAVDELEGLAHEALPLLEEAGDHAGLVHVWWAIGSGVANFRAKYDEWAKAADQALHHSRLAGQYQTDLFRLPDSLFFGGTPADEALRRLDAVLPEPAHPSSLLWRAVLLAMLNRFDEAQPLAADAGARLRELTGDAAGGFMLSQVAHFAGNDETAARELRQYCDLLQERGLRFQLSSYAPLLGRLFCMLGRRDEAVPLVELARELGDEQDVITQMAWRQVHALISAGRGEYADAETLAREAVALARTTDGLNWQGDAFCDLAEVLRAAGRIDEATATIGQALECYDRKKNLAIGARVRTHVPEWTRVGASGRNG
jgi:class 3 adenylate cyclase/tetratricopeptide (TPR) repeat protein